MVAALAVAAIAEPADAKVTFAGIGDARLNMSEADLTDALGPPSSSKPWRGPDAVRLDYPKPKLQVVLDRSEDRVVLVSTTSRGERTSSGLGVGSSARVVRDRLRGEKCGTAQGTVVCSVERAGRIMDFEIRRRKVFRVGVAVAP